MSLEYIQIDPEQTADACVIWLHGLGADGHDFEGIVPELALPAEMAVRFILPHAPSIPVSVNGGYVMPAWYDIKNQEINQVIDYEGINHSSKQVDELIQEQLDLGISSKRIILAGFSQGGAVVYHSALNYPKPLGGLLALSTYFATHDNINYHQSNANLAIMICHGSEDPVVPHSLSEQAFKTLKDNKYTVDIKSYPMPHSVCSDEIDDISAWLQSLLKP